MLPDGWLAWRLKFDAILEDVEKKLDFISSESLKAPDATNELIVSFNNMTSDVAKMQRALKKIKSQNSGLEKTILENQKKILSGETQNDMVPIIETIQVNLEDAFGETRRILKRDLEQSEMRLQDDFAEKLKRLSVDQSSKFDALNETLKNLAKNNIAPSPKKSNYLNYRSPAHSACASSTAAKSTRYQATTTTKTPAKKRSRSGREQSFADLKDFRKKVMKKMLAAEQ